MQSPPEDLVESYYSCTPSELDAFLDAVGVAAGNQALAQMIFAAICTYISWIFLRAQNHPKPLFKGKAIANKVEELAISKLEEELHEQHNVHDVHALEVDEDDIELAPTVQPKLILSSLLGFKNKVEPHLEFQAVGIDGK